MKCKYCNKDVKPVGNNLETVNGVYCEANTTHKHALLSDGVHCVFCGRETKKLGDRIVTSYGVRCPASPSGKHVL
ncbi:hypothetical protein [Treponema pedis]|uniref:Uncharacterized protein n=2 Tax=Treponema pedis TaxID=409322 RepID=S5ZRL3_9SPIR|nr:hypothetical protein [Treponema pedis]AGT42665.1 hypothetical protein TPE_0169 [Treponema pedis str. T A4]QOW61679.1 hypothetical protein IFE08_04705 [Treponema pedis]QSI03552.1 hypothetical protein DYQ05_00795 [Treponema pedis]